MSDTITSIGANSQVLSLKSDFITSKGYIKNSQILQHLAQKLGMDPGS